MRVLMLFVLVLCPVAFASRPCFGPEEAIEHSEKDVCVSAHVYDVVQSADGIRYLDVCKPESADSACRFTVISLPGDRKEVGDLEGYREQDIRIRGVVHTMHGQSVIILSQARQFKDGAEKFRPNPRVDGRFFSGEREDRLQRPGVDCASPQEQ